MLKSTIIVVSIDRPVRTVYGFLSDPANLSQWGTNYGTDMQRLGERDYLVELPLGRRVIRFAEPNDWGVLDYTLFAPGETPGDPVPVRVYRNQAGTDLVLTLFRQPEMTDEEFASRLDWVRSDLERAKAVIEAEY